MYAWPPQLADVRRELGRKPEDRADDPLLQAALDAAVEFVTRVRGSSFNFAAAPTSTLPSPTSDIALGTVRLAIRQHTRRRSPDGLVAMGDLGVGRIPSFDPDIERLLGIGRYAGVVFG